MWNTENLLIDGNMLHKNELSLYEDFSKPYLIRVDYFTSNPNRNICTDLRKLYSQDTTQHLRLFSVVNPSDLS